MARERRVTCGDHSFTTRANPRVRIKCPTCNTAHRAPAIEDGWKGPGTEADDASHDVAGAVADLASEVLPPPASTAIKITRATHSAARATAKATKATKATKKSSRRRPPASPRPPARTASQAAGRRGGLATASRPAFLRRVGR